MLRGEAQSGERSVNVSVECMVAMRWVARLRFAWASLAAVVWVWTMSRDGEQSDRKFGLGSGRPCLAGVAAAASPPPHRRQRAQYLHTPVKVVFLPSFFRWKPPSKDYCHFGWRGRPARPAPTRSQCCRISLFRTLKMRLTTTINPYILGLLSSNKLIKITFQGCRANDDHNVRTANFTKIAIDLLVSQTLILPYHGFLIPPYRSRIISLLCPTLIQVYFTKMSSVLNPWRRCRHWFERHQVWRPFG